MAIQFLNSVNLSQNELIKARIENQPNNAAAGTGVEGQLYYDTTLDVLKVWANGAWAEVGGGVTSFTATDGTFINLTPNTTQGGAATLVADLSATGTPDSTVYLRGDNTWAPISGIVGTTYDLDSIQVGSDVAITLVGSDATTDTVTLVAGTNITLTDNGAANITIDAANPDQTVTLTGEVTGTGTTSITTTVADGVLDVANFNASAIVIEAEGIENNDNDTTIPTSAAVKAYVDASTVGGLVYQGGYNAATNTPDLDSSPSASIKKGWTYTVTADGLFFTEQVRVGDVLIAEIDAPTTLADWTTVQNNIDLASASQIGIGNVVASTADQLLGVDVTYNGSGTAAVGLDIEGLTLVSSLPEPDDTFLPYYDDATVINGRISVFNLGNQISSYNSYATTITDTATISHGLSSSDVMVQLYDITTGETVYADVDRISTTQVTITFATTPTNSIRVLVQKIG
jgi:hypothetical protein